MIFLIEIVIKSVFEYDNEVPLMEYSIMLASNSLEQPLSIIALSNIIGAVRFSDIRVDKEVLKLNVFMNVIFSMIYCNVD